MLSFETLSKTYADGTHALSAITIDVAAGEILALVGGSGCGKTTLLRLIAGLDQPSAGRILLDGEAILEPRADVGVIFQEPRLFPWLSVSENVAFGLSHLSAFEREGLVANALVRVGLAGYEKRWPRELSGGQQQRVAIARALITRPKLLLMDEPFSALDATTRASLHGHLLALWAESRPTVVMVTHDVEEAVTLADRIIVMQPKPGRIFDELDNPLARPRDRLSPSFEATKREALRALDRSLRDEEPRQHKTAETAGMWW
ncbi:ABC transporter ATP-binding protein [Bosea lathyri]|jgi:sulfonate transport system ATP-binding protein|uniref:Sulfonate transport system ATP-binding protein n=1 Tax=Bosea lathyri TaxID=1036778 RepID=A0A1H5SI77_9HYPH|nr:ABC transporter ATP-binding protein [Bosea lathyri]SEF49501.1 sulfonate transport system ATP-binding protein [Bosea lathyri]